MCSAVFSWLLGCQNENSFNVIRHVAEFPARLVRMRSVTSRAASSKIEDDDDVNLRKANAANLDVWNDTLRKTWRELVLFETNLDVNAEGFPVSASF